MKRCCIIGGAPIQNYPRAQSFIKDEDFVIYCDGGLKHFLDGGLERRPDLLVGDFDSCPEEQARELAESIVLPCEKDDTDTVFAMKEGLRRGYKEFVFLGVLGGRLDHTLGNVYMLEYLARAHGEGVLVDDFSESRLVEPGKTAYVEESFPYFSLLNISGTARGITIEGAKYPLKDGEIKSFYQYGISNEVLPGQRAKITLTEGSLLLIKVAAENIRPVGF